MDKISGLPDELLVKILYFLPPKLLVSTSVLSKRWESLWLWIPELEFLMNHYESDLLLRDFITRNLLLLKPPVLERFCLLCYSTTFQPENIKHWVETSVSRCVRELDINYYDRISPLKSKPVVLLPSSLYTCKLLVTLRLNGSNITVDVPRTVFLPSLKTLELGEVTYSNAEAQQLLLSYCPVLEDLVIDRHKHDNLNTVVITVPSLLRLSLQIDCGSSHEVYEIVTPSLKYFKVEYFYGEYFSYLIMDMPKVEKADLFVEENVERLFESITSVKILSLCVLHINKDEESMYRSGIVFNQLEHLKLHINHDYWSKLLVRLLEDSPKLRVLKLLVEINPQFKEYELLSWYNDESSVPKCLLESLETFEFAGYTGKQEEKDFVSYILKNASHLKSSSIKHQS